MALEQGAGRGDGMKGLQCNKALTCLKVYFIHCRRGCFCQGLQRNMKDV
jgi:hypothetical protein